MKTVVGFEAFEKEVIRKGEPVVVLFEATYCPFSQAFRKVIERYDGKLPLRIVSVLLDDWGDPLWIRYRIEVTPTLAVFSGGRMTYRIDGVLGVGLSERDVRKLAAYLATQGKQETK